MSRGENSAGAAVAVIVIAGLFVLLLLGGAAFAVFGLYSVRSAGPPPTASVASLPPMTVSPARPVIASPSNPFASDIPLVIDYGGIITVDGQVQSEEQSRQYFASYKAAKKIPVIFAHENAPPDRLERMQQLCTEIVGRSADVNTITSLGGIRPNVNQPADMPAESPAP